MNAASDLERRKSRIKCFRFKGFLWNYGSGRLEKKKGRSVDDISF